MPQKIKKDSTTNFEKILNNKKTESLVLDDVVSNLLKILSQYFVILAVILIIIVNLYFVYVRKPVVE